MFKANKPGESQAVEWSVPPQLHIPSFKDAHLWGVNQTYLDLDDLYDWADNQLAPLELIEEDEDGDEVYELAIPFTYSVGDPERVHIDDFMPPLVAIMVISLGFLYLHLTDSGNNLLFKVQDVIEYALMSPEEQENHLARLAGEKALQEELRQIRAQRGSTGYRVVWWIRDDGTYVIQVIEESPWDKSGGESPLEQPVSPLPVSAHDPYAIAGIREVAGSSYIDVSNPVLVDLSWQGNCPVHESEASMSAYSTGHFVLVSMETGQMFEAIGPYNTSGVYIDGQLATYGLWLGEELHQGQWWLMRDTTYPLRMRFFLHGSCGSISARYDFMRGLE